MSLSKREKNIWRILYIGVPVLIIILFIFFDFGVQSIIGTWDHQSGTLTYLNQQQHMKLTFPNEDWRVYTKPEDLPSEGIILERESFLYDLRAQWLFPTEDDPGYHILLADFPEIRPFQDSPVMQMSIIPLSAEISSIEDFLSYLETGYKQAYEMGVLPSLDIESLRSDIKKRNGRRTGIIFHKTKNAKKLRIIFKETKRFISFSFGCTEGFYESWEEQFWEIVDSYEYVE